MDISRIDTLLLEIFTKERMLNFCYFFSGYFGLCAPLSISRKFEIFNRLMQVVFVPIAMAPIYMLFYILYAMAWLAAIPLIISASDRSFSNIEYGLLAIVLIIGSIGEKGKDILFDKMVVLIKRDQSTFAFASLFFLLLATIIIPELSKM